MKKILNFTVDELQEMENLRILGGKNDTMGVQDGCVNDECINGGCLIQSKCPGIPDINCTNKA